MRRTRTLAAAVCLAFVSSACSSSNSTTVPRTTASSSPSLLSTKIKHVFVLIQENHTFDNYFGLYPGAGGQTVENLGSSTATADDCVPDPQVPGTCQRPFLISPNTASPNYVADAPDINGGDNSRFGQEASVDGGKMDGFLADAEGGAAPLGPSPSAAAIQAHNQSIEIESVYDCDTIPYLWYYANNFALFDHYFQAETGASTPSNIELFAGQIGQTEAAAQKGTASVESGGGYTDGVPISNDDNPPQSLVSVVPAYSGPDNATFQSYASFPVLLNPAEDSLAFTAGITGFIPDDIKLEGASTRKSFPWAWYEEGMLTPGAGFVQHHAAPLYFDYINHPSSPFATTSTLRENTLSNGLISDIKSGTLPSSGVFFVKGGSSNQYGLKPADPVFTSNSAGKVYYVGDDDHPGSTNSDHQVAEAYLAEVINAIANSNYWKDSVILVTWDDSGGFYDHLPPPSYGATCPQDASGPEAGHSCGDGVRLPLLVISPFAKTGTVVHDLSDGGSIVKFIEAVFGLPTFASLPDEAAGVAANLAPADADSATSNITDALDPNKLSGTTAPNPASMATIAGPSVPPTMSCATLGMTPIHSPASVPAGFHTVGSYLHASLTGAAPAYAIRQPRDDGD